MLWRKMTISSGGEKLLSPSSRVSGGWWSSDPLTECMRERVPGGGNGGRQASTKEESGPACSARELAPASGFTLPRAGLCLMLCRQTRSSRAQQRQALRPLHPEALGPGRSGGGPETAEYRRGRTGARTLICLPPKCQVFFLTQQFLPKSIH